MEGGLLTWMEPWCVAGAKTRALEPCQQCGFSVQEQFPHLNWLSGALGVTLAPLNSPCYWESNSPGGWKEVGPCLGGCACCTWETIAGKICRGRKFKVAVIDRQFWRDCLSLDLPRNGGLVVPKCCRGRTADKALRAHLYPATSQMGHQEYRKGLENC